MAAEIEGYASVASAAPGDTVDFHVRVSDARYAHLTMSVFRRGTRDELTTTLEGDAVAGAAVDDARLAAEGCDWPAVDACRIVVPETWRGGYYVARLAAAGAETWIPFFVRAGVPGAASKVLVKVSDATAQAYTAWGGRSFYSTPHAPRISFDRPYDDLDLFERYQLPFVRWAETRGYVLDYCSSIDLHLEPQLLAPYRLFVSLGHDEYWSLEMRDQVEAFVAAGGNACFLSANTCFWQVRFDFTQGRRIMICYKETEGNPPDPERLDPRRVTVQWSTAPVNRPENRMTGVSYRNGAGWWIDPLVPEQRYRGYTVTNAAHWVYDATGLADGDVFGAGSSVDDAILGYETDAALPVPGSVPLAASGDDGTPRDFTFLATADLRDWQPHGQGGAATMGIHQRGGVVFTAGTVNWCGGLAAASGGASPVAAMTRTLLDTLVRRPAPLPLSNGAFETWENGSPSGWTLDGAGAVREAADPALVANYLRFAAGNRRSAAVDATAGETWLGLAELNLDGATAYGAGCWVNAGARGATIRLQTTDTWVDFATAEHSGSGEWEYLFAVGTADRPGAVVPARVKIQVAGGTRAAFAGVAVVPAFAATPA